MDQVRLHRHGVCTEQTVPSAAILLEPANYALQSTPDGPSMSEAAPPAVTPWGRQAKIWQGVTTSPLGKRQTWQTREMRLSALWCSYWREGGKVCEGSLCRDALPVLLLAILAFLLKHLFVRILSQDSEALDLCCKTYS